MLAIEVTADHHVQAGTGAAAALLVEMQGHAVGLHDVVAPDDTFLLDTQDLLEIHAAEGRMRAVVRAQKREPRRFINACSTRTLGNTASCSAR